MARLEEAITRLEELIGEVEQLGEPGRSVVFELLAGIDAIHRMALEALGDALGDETLGRLRNIDPAIAWLLDAYAIGIDEKAAADAALEEIRPYIHSHGGKVQVLEAHRGMVRVKLSGACSGCTASAVTLQEGIEEAFRERLPGFAAMEVEEEEAEEHPPPGPTLLQLRRPDGTVLPAR